MSHTLSASIEKRYPDITIQAQFEQALDGYRATALFGPSGCGKTTILRSIAGLIRPEQGRIHWDDECWNDTDRGAFMPPQHRRVGLLFQDYALFPHMTVEQNIGYGLPRGTVSTQAVSEIMNRFQIAGMNRRKPSELSGGQQQRVALARAVVRRPRLLLLDEPLSALDATTRHQVRRELRDLLVAGGIPALVVTHDPIEAVTLAERIIVMDQGRILQQGAAEDVFSRPANLAVAGIVGVETVQRGERQAEVGRTSAQNTLQGTVADLAAEGPLFRVVVECGFPLTALISKQAKQDLQLEAGQSVTALIKATAIHLIGRRNG